MPAVAAATAAAKSWCCLEPALAANSECVSPGWPDSDGCGAISGGRGNAGKPDVGTDPNPGYGPRNAPDVIGYMAGVCLIIKNTHNAAISELWAQVIN